MASELAYACTSCRAWDQSAVKSAAQISTAIAEGSGTLGWRECTASGQSYQHPARAMVSPRLLNSDRLFSVRGRPSPARCEITAMTKVSSRRHQLCAAAIALFITSLLEACSGGRSSHFNPGPVPTPVATFAPYQDMSLTGMSAGVQQNDLPPIAAASGITHFTMAFITSAGNACNPEWGGVGPISGDTTFTSYISQLRLQGGDVIISFGGEAGDNLTADGGGPDYERSE